MINSNNIKKILELAREEYKLNWEELHQKNNKSFLKLCYIISNSKDLIKELE